MGNSGYGDQRNLTPPCIRSFSWVVSYRESVLIGPYCPEMRRILYGLYLSPDKHYFISDLNWSVDGIRYAYVVELTVDEYTNVVCELREINALAQGPTPPT